MARIGIVGAGSLLGRELLHQLEPLPTVQGVSLYSERAAGTELSFRNTDQTVEELDDEALSEMPETVILLTGAERSRRWSPRLVAAGRRIIDFSSAFRLDPKVPLVGLTPQPRSSRQSLPAAAPLAAARLLQPWEELAGLDRVEATLLVPVSSAGAKAVRELSRQTADLLSGRRLKARVFSHRIAYNVIPQVGAMTGDASVSERSFAAELQRLLGRADLPVMATAVRVPVFFGLSLCLSMVLRRRVDLKLLRNQYRAMAGLKLLEGAPIYPMPSLAAGDEALLAGRLRLDSNHAQLFGAVDGLMLLARLAVQTAVG